MQNSLRLLATNSLVKTAEKSKADFSQLAKGRIFNPETCVLVKKAPIRIAKLLGRKAELKAELWAGMPEEDKRENERLQSLLYHLAEHELLEVLRRSQAPDQEELFMCQGGEIACIKERVETSEIRLVASR